MSSRAFSSVVLNELLKEIEQIEEGIGLDDEKWAAAMTTKHSRAIQEEPVVYLTEEDNFLARQYLARYKELGMDLADRATRFIRDKHAADIREYLKTKHENQSALIEHDSTEDNQYFLPSDDRAPTCFEEWFAVTEVWRLTLAMKEIPFQDAAFGTPECLLSPLPKPWEDKLNECMQITDGSAILPVPKGYGLSITRHDLNSILPTSDANTDLSGLLSDTIRDQWFRILISYRNQRKPGSTVVVPSDSLDLAAATPQEVSEKAMLVNADIDMILFPTVIKEQDHCILLAACPQRRAIAVYDSLGPESTKALQKKRPWIKEGEVQLEEAVWEVMWLQCTLQGEEAASGVFMFITALLLCRNKTLVGGYSKDDSLFLRRYIAAVICMGELPEDF